MTNWYYAMGDEREGPVEAAEIERMIGTGQISRDTLVWREGLNGWEPAMQHFSFAVASPPPLNKAASAPDPVAPTYINETSSFSNTSSSSSASVDIGADGLYVGAPGRSFGEAISTCFSKYVTFSGRASRSEYWFFVLFLVLAGIGASILDAILFPGSLETGGPINGILSLATLLPSLAVGWRRLHDTDRSGWWIGGFYLAIILVAVIAVALLSGGTEEAGAALFGLMAIGGLIYAIVLLVFFCQKGTMGPNRYG